MDATPYNLMMFGNPWQFMAVVLVVLVLFGKGKVSDLMGDVAKGIKAFKKGLAEDEAPPAANISAPTPIEQDKARAESLHSTETGTKV